MTTRTDVAIIGGGQAGLALGWHLARQGTGFVIIDANPRVGDSWRSRWSSLRLFTPARFNGLPGMPFPGDPEHCPDKDEVADYLEAYARAFDLRVDSGEQVHTVRPQAGGGFLVGTSERTLEAAQVVLATGPFQQPAVPALAATLNVQSLHSSEYRDPAQLADGPAVVVGAGNSGVQIAADLARSRETWLCVGTRMGRLPARVLGRSIFWWLDRSGGLDLPVDSWLGRWASARDVLIGAAPSTVARELGVRLAGRVVDAAGAVVRTADGRSIAAGSVVWATGFRSDYRFLHAPVVDADGRAMHRRGVTRVPGLYFLGLPWQHTRGSALLGGVGRDAAFIARQIAAARGRAWAGRSARGAAR